MPRSPEDLVLGNSVGCLGPAGTGGDVGEQVSTRAKESGILRSLLLRAVISGIMLL